MSNTYGLGPSAMVYGARELSTTAPQAFLDFAYARTRTAPRRSADQDNPRSDANWNVERDVLR
jgi:hypothetical protein